jgi:4-hydroxy-tetrahydrodipicolinate synthase
MDNRFLGTGVALVTPFHSDKTIDFKSLKKVIDHCIEGGVNYLVTLGTTGESVVLSSEEQQEVIYKTLEFINNRVPLVAGFGGANTAQTISNLQTFDLKGVAAILSSSPNYNKPSQEGLYQHYKAIAESTDLPIILYNVPSRTSKNMEARTTIRLANDFKNIIAIKEASNNMAQCMDIVRKTNDDFLLISGDDVHALPMISFGGKGVISVVAQATPKTFSSMINQALNNDFEAASKNQFKVQDLIYQIFKENNPAGIKAALNILGICENELRLPLVPVSNKLFEKIENSLQGLS